MELKTYLREKIDWDLPFSPAEYAARRKQVRDAMARAGIDLLLLCRLPDINWLTGYDMVWHHLRNSTTLAIRTDSVDTIFFDAAAHTTIVSLVPEIRDAVFFDHDRQRSLFFGVICEIFSENTFFSVCGKKQKKFEKKQKKYNN